MSTAEQKRERRVAAKASLDPAPPTTGTSASEGTHKPWIERMLASRRANKAARDAGQLVTAEGQALAQARQRKHDSYIRTRDRKLGKLPPYVSPGGATPEERHQHTLELQRIWRAKRRAAGLNQQGTPLKVPPGTSRHTALADNAAKARAAKVLRNQARWREQKKAERAARKEAKRAALAPPSPLAVLASPRFPVGHAPRTVHIPLHGSIDSLPDVFTQELVDPQTHKNGKDLDSLASLILAVWRKL